MAEHARKPPTRLAPIPTVQETLEIEVHQLLSGVLLVEIRGAIDGVTAPELQRRIGAIPLAGLSGPPRLLLDLSGVTFLDLAGLDVVLHLQDRWGNAAGTVELVAPSPSVVRLLHEAELDGVSWMTPIDTPHDDHPAP